MRGQANIRYLLIKYIKSVLWRVAKCLSYIEEAQCLKVKALLRSIKYTHLVRIDVILCRYVYVGDYYGTVTYLSCYQVFVHIPGHVNATSTM